MNCVFLLKVSALQQFKVIKYFSTANGMRITDLNFSFVYISLSGRPGRFADMTTASVSYRYHKISEEGLL